MTEDATTPRASDAFLAGHARPPEPTMVDGSRVLAAAPRTPGATQRQALHRWQAASAIAITVLMLLGSLGMSVPAIAQDPVLVPNVIGLPEAQAVSAIQGVGLGAVNAGSNYDLNVPLGSVVSQDPPATTQVATGTTVNYVVSAGPPPQSQQPTPKPTPTPKPSPTPKPPPTPKPTPWPTPPGVKGVDVSHWNGAPNFYSLRGHGMEFVFSKATQGTWLQDETFLRNTQEARAAGLLPGAYHFFDYNKGGKEQAKHFVATVQNTTGLAGLLPLVVDVETLKSLGTPNPTLARTRLHLLLDELYRQTGRYPMIYTSREMWKRVVGEPDDFGAYPLWVACWKCDTVHMPRGWSDWDFWQVGPFQFPDVPTLDGNTYRSSPQKLRHELQKDMRLNKGAEWVASTTALADLSGYDGTEVRVALEDGGFGPWTPFQHPYPVQLGNQQGPRNVLLQLRSYRGVPSPVISDAIQLDSVPPKVKGPWIAMGSGGQLGRDADRVPVTAKIEASDATSGLDSSRVEASCGARRASRTRQAQAAELSMNIDRTGCTLTGIATDKVGHTGSSSLSPRIQLRDVRERSRDFSFKGDWKTARMKSAIGRTLTQASERGARMRLPFEGAQYAIVTRRGPTGGQLDVLVDGKRVTTLDLYSKKSDSRRVVHVGSVSKRKHVLELRPTGTSNPASTGTTVWLDAVLVLDRQK